MKPSFHPLHTRSSLRTILSRWIWFDRYSQIYWFVMLLNWLKWKWKYVESILWLGLCLFIDSSCLRSHPDSFLSVCLWLVPSHRSAVFPDSSRPSCPLRHGGRLLQRSQMSTGWWHEFPSVAETKGDNVGGQTGVCCLLSGPVQYQPGWNRSQSGRNHQVDVSGQLCFRQSPQIWGNYEWLVFLWLRKSDFFFLPGGGGGWRGASEWPCCVSCLIHWRGISADISTLSILCVIRLPFSHSVPSRLPSPVGWDKNLWPLWRFLWEVHSPGSQRSPPASPLKPRPRMKPRPVPRCWTPVTWAPKAHLRSIIDRKLPSSLMAAKGSVYLQPWATGPPLGPASKLQKKPTYFLLTVIKSNSSLFISCWYRFFKYRKRDILEQRGRNIT